MAGGTYGGGNGTNSTPYLVEDKADFLAMASATTGFFKQTADISFSGSPGGYNVLHPKSYDGNGFKILNFVGANKALFVEITGTVSNLTIKDAVMLGNLANVNGLSIFATSINSANALVTNCHATGSVEYTGTTDQVRVGGFASVIETQARVNNCSFIGTVLCNHNGSNVGGFVSAINSSFVNDCWSSGTVRAPNSFDDSGYGVGGFCCKISSNTTEVRRCYSLCDVYGNSRAGGFCSMLGSGTGTIVEDCYSKGNVYGTGVNVGGFAGTVYAQGAGGSRVSRCYSTGFVRGANSVGGFIGLVWYADSPIITNCYSLAPYVQRTSGLSNTFGRFVATLASAGADAKFSNNYALSTMEFRG